jgi:hypothetical protein
LFLQCVTCPTFTIHVAPQFFDSTLDVAKTPLVLLSVQVWAACRSVPVGLPVKHFIFEVRDFKPDTLLKRLEALFELVDDALCFLCDLDRTARVTFSGYELFADVRREAAADHASGISYGVTELTDEVEECRHLTISLR